MYNRGTFFSSNIINDGRFVLPNVRPVGSDILLVLYCRDFMEDIEAKFDTPLSQDEIQYRTQTTSHRSSQLTRKRKKTKRVVEGGSSDDSLSVDEEEGDLSTMAAAPAIMSSITGISGLSDLLLQFPSDILQLVPKPKSAAEE